MMKVRFFVSTTTVSIFLLLQLLSLGSIIEIHGYNAHCFSTRTISRGTLQRARNGNTPTVLYAKRNNNNNNNNFFLDTIVPSFLLGGGEGGRKRNNGRWKQLLTKSFTSTTRRTVATQSSSNAISEWNPDITTTTNKYNDTRIRTNVLDGIGMPSKPGWKSGKLNRLTEWASSKKANRPVICEYEPSSRWLWTKWQGTLLSLTYRSVVLSMVTGFIIDYWFVTEKFSKVYTNWPLLVVPDPTQPLIQSLEGLRRLWGYQFTLATFVLTFFTSQAYAYWQKVYNTSRAIQGRINDFCMLLTIAAQRKNHTNNNDNTNNNKGKPTKSLSKSSNTTKTAKNAKTEYTTEARQLLQLCTRLIRVSHTFFWAATPTASNGLSDCEEFIKQEHNIPLPVDDEHIGPLLLSSYGLKALVNTGQLTEDEMIGLRTSGLPPSEYQFILLIWAGIYAMNGIRTGILNCTAGFEENLLRQLTTLRGEYFNIDDYRAGRMPLAYVQIVQVLIDSLLLVAPFALYPELGFLSIPLAGLMTLFFKGLLELSKSFLDPFGVEGYAGQNIRVDVLVSELNFGASTRWLFAGKSLPSSSTFFSDGSNKNNNRSSFQSDSFSSFSASLLSPSIPPPPPLPYQ